jgi:hypothetical protein
MNEISRPLSVEEFEVRAKPQLLKLCKTINPDAFNQPFRDLGFSRILLYEFWMPSGRFATGLSKVCQDLNENTFFVSCLGYDPDKKNNLQYHWEIIVGDIATFDKFIGPVEYTMYSKSGAWAIVSSLELHGVITCPAEILAILRDYVHDVEKQVFAFLEYYKPKHWTHDPPNSEFLKEFLSHLYGPKRAADLLKRSGF